MTEFERHRPLLWSIAYRMLGSASDAEDLLQEAYLRARAMPDDVVSERAYLSSIVTRLCLDHWKSARVKRESYAGTWLPEPVHTDPPVDPASISLAFLVLLESLSPLERAVYLLAEVFDYTHTEIAAILGRDESACRQLLHRAREHVRQRRPRFAPSCEVHRRLLESFQTACVRGDLGQLEDLLAEDAVSIADGGGKVPAAPKPVQGKQRVARLFSGLFRKAPAETSSQILDINGLPALLVRVAGKVVAVVDIETDGTRILAIRTILNPEKLAHLDC